MPAKPGGLKSSVSWSNAILPGIFSICLGAESLCHIISSVGK